MSNDVPKTPSVMPSNMTENIDRCCFRYANPSIKPANAVLVVAVTL